MKFRIATLSALSATLLGLSAFNAPSAEAWTQPYGGCKEAWQAPHSAGAQECRDHGWTVRPRLVVSPHAIVKYTRLPHCTVEDGGDVKIPCSWNMDDLPHPDGNDVGLAYWISPTAPFGIAHYVWRDYPIHDGWRWLTQCERHQWAKVYGHRDRYWKKAVIKVDDGFAKVKLPNGKHYTN